jgi:hypothetical protein
MEYLRDDGVRWASAPTSALKLDHLCDPVKRADRHSHGLLHAPRTGSGRKSPYPFSLPQKRWMRRQASSSFSVDVA